MDERSRSANTDHRTTELGRVGPESEHGTTLFMSLFESLSAYRRVRRQVGGWSPGRSRVRLSPAVATTGSMFAHVAAERAGGVRWR